MRISCVYIITGIMIFNWGCRNPKTDLTIENPDVKVIFLHHSTGNNVWYGDLDRDKKIYSKNDVCMVPRLIMEYNLETGSRIGIEEVLFPSGDQYPWANYPYDYYNIWVKNGGDEPYMGESTLEMLTGDFDVIIFKHCFPVSHVVPDDSMPDINSDKKTLANYQLQYNALKNKLHQFPENKFIVWTGAALLESNTSQAEALRAREFSNWVKLVWNDPEDNIFLFDFREIETDGGLYLLPKYAKADSDPHPNKSLSQIVAKRFVSRIIDVVETDGKTTDLMGNPLIINRY